MAQDFERTLNRNISNTTSAATSLRTAADSDDAIIGIRCCNTGTGTVNVSVYVTNSSTDYFIQKDAPVIAGGALELIDGGSKVVLQSGDSVHAYTDTASSLDIVLSVVDSIST